MAEKHLKNKKWIWRYSAKAERKFFFFAALAMAVLSTLLEHFNF
ncbi:hypothetical protein X474_10585 [Dethiosulfatarculus sandiegensis]|uniref:Uncharacterized protein n=1 Tax=Dethiosulfatarculus sandiegensis TaxID=1429043 RepID=A0A0D2GGP7_9BACT|nr:hypothetical protein X474_10585 [Dethiosulfatarculus sandiegensis]